MGLILGKELGEALGVKDRVQYDLQPMAEGGMYRQGETVDNEWRQVVEIPLPTVEGNS